MDSDNEKRTGRPRIHDLKGFGAVCPNCRVPARFEPTVDSEQAAAFICIHKKTLQRLARNGQVPAYRIGTLWKFRISELDDWLRSELSSRSHSCREDERR